MGIKLARRPGTPPRLSSAAAARTGRVAVLDRRLRGAAGRDGAHAHRALRLSRHAMQGCLREGKQHYWQHRALPGATDRGVACPRGAVHHRAADIGDRRARDIGQVDRPKVVLIAAKVGACARPPRPGHSLQQRGQLLPGPFSQPAAAGRARAAYPSLTPACRPPSGLRWGRRRQSPALDAEATTIVLHACGQRMIFGNCAIDAARTQVVDKVFGGRGCGVPRDHRDGPRHLAAAHARVRRRAEPSGGLHSRHFSRSLDGTHRVVGAAGRAAQDVVCRQRDIVARHRRQRHLGTVQHLKPCWPSAKVPQENRESSARFSLREAGHRTRADLARGW